MLFEKVLNIITDLSEYNSLIDALDEKMDFDTFYIDDHFWLDEILPEVEMEFNVSLRDNREAFNLCGYDLTLREFINVVIRLINCR
jgi:hypothetical protein